MAVGDFTIDNDTLQIKGHAWQVSGTAEINGTLTAFDILPGKHILSLEVNGVDDAGAVRRIINQDASGNEDQGNVAMQSNIDTVNTYDWTAIYRG